MRNLAIGILAHVDAGKTTLSEEMLFVSGQIRSYGRVDNGDAFLDTYELEKERGITIFSKQAVINLEHMKMTLLDTPGHVDFFAEMERTLQVMDYAILVISGTSGVQSHTLTLWKLLERYRIPVFLFINKMDQLEEVSDYCSLTEAQKQNLAQRRKQEQERLMGELRTQLSSNCMNFSFLHDEAECFEQSGQSVYDFMKEHATEDWMENVSLCDEGVMEHYLEEGEVTKAQIVQMIRERKLFPCYFGSALKHDGVDLFLKGIEEFAEEPFRPKEFGARVFKISRDAQGRRLTFMKVTGGSLKVRSILRGQQKTASLSAETEESGEWEEKISQIRIYSGEKFTAEETVDAGTVCAVTGLNYTYPGEGFGVENDGYTPMLEPVLTYRVVPASGCDLNQFLVMLRQLEEEEPALHVSWDEQVGEIHVQVMGEIQVEILQRLIEEKYGIYAIFDEGSIVYKETIANTVIGLGHFEPLRHYAEVHLLMEPGEPGSGMQFFTDCSEDILSRNWQRLILTHLKEKEHRGVLTGSPITDIRITLIAGRAHLKHTEGGDFRQATYRAVRQGLKQAESVLLEPYYAFRIELPPELVGRAMMDIERMNGKISPPELEGDFSILTGSAPAVTMGNYQKELNTYTHGAGRMTLTVDGYFPCHNQEEVVERIGYDSELDLRNPTFSVFCTHGAGFAVPWYEVPEYIHIKEEQSRPEIYAPMPSASEWEPEAVMDEEEVNEILARTFGKNSGEKKNTYKKTRTYNPAPSSAGGNPVKRPKKEKEYLLVDGYNVIHSWKELNELSEVDFGAARDKLADILSNYQGYKNNIIILVFDAYKVKGGKGEVSKYHNIYIVYTKEAETADQYIEKTAHKIGRTDRVTVATSDGLEQVIIRGQGCILLSARELQEEIAHTERQITENVDQQNGAGRNYLLDQAEGDVAEYIEKALKDENQE